MRTTPLTTSTYVLDGAVNAAVLVAGSKAVLVDCCDTVTPERLAELGISQVEMILCTQHRRPNVAGAYPFVRSGAKLVVPAEERHLFENTDAYWNDPASRWHIYRHQPGPQVLATPIPVARAVREPEVLEWQGLSIRVLDTPGATDGSVSYLVQDGDETVCFSGDAIYGPGQLWDLCSLQKGFGGVCDYHGFIGNKLKLAPSLRKIAGSGANLLVPSHGQPIRQPGEAIALLLDRLELAWRSHASISSMNHYFPNLLNDVKDDPKRMMPVTTHEPPAFVRRVAGTTFAVISETGAALIMDCGSEAVVTTLQNWLRDGAIRSVDGCWVTHYHDDHVNGLPKPRQAFGCPIMTDEHLAEIIEYPLRFCLPCISPDAAPVARKTRHGESWQWREFTLTAFHFPGQTYYHSGLLVEGHGTKVFFAGDSGSPTGIDDHCCPNRNFLGQNRGFRQCLAIWRQTRPNFIFNEHQNRAFSFTDAELDTMDAVLAERERLFGELLPWEHPDFGTDENWVRAYPFEQQVGRGDPFSVDVQFTNHGPRPTAAIVEPVLPGGWTWDKERSVAEVVVPARTDGSVDSYCANPDKAATVWLAASKEAAPGRYVIPFRVTWGGRYLGQFRHGIVNVT